MAQTTQPVVGTDFTGVSDDTATRTYILPDGTMVHIEVAASVANPNPVVQTAG